MSVDRRIRLATRPLAAAGRDLRLVPAAVLAWVGGGWLVGAPSWALPVAVTAWVAAGAAIAFAVVPSTRRRGLAAVALGAGAVALVATSVAMGAPVRAPPALDELHGTVVVAFVVTEEASAGAERLRGTASTLGPVVGHVPVLVVGANVAVDLGIGATVRLRGHVSSLPPGGGIAALVIATEAAIEVVAPPPGWLAWGNSLRADFRELAAGLPGDGGVLLTGLAIGDDRGVPPPLEAAMRASSLTHLTAVSGANCAIVVGAVMLLGAVLRVRRRWRILGALVVLAAFVVLVTPQPSVVRAGVMTAFALTGFAVSRPMRGLPLLSLAVVGILVVDPWASREFGFVLSVLATAGLLVLSGPLARALSGIMPSTLALIIAVPIAAQLACQPALALLAPGVPTYGIPANLLAVPAAPLATIGGLIACLLAPLAPPLALGAAWIAWLPSSWIAGVATTFSTMPLARMPWPDGLLGVGLHVVTLAAVAVCLMGRGRLRLLAVLTVAGVVVGVGGAAIGRAVVGGTGRPPDWQIAMCEVGQGDAAVVRSGAAIAVIDTGPDPEPLTACLNDLGIGRVDLLVLTHFDRDHVGGSSALIGRVDRVLIGVPDEDAERTVVWPLVAGGASVEEVRRGDGGVLGALAWQVLWPRKIGTPEAGNAASVVVRFDPLESGLSAVFLGDLGEPEQRRLVAAGVGGPVDVVKVAHHGSADQAEAMYVALASPIALIGVGAGNDYGHPTELLLDLLACNGAETGRTDVDGLLLVARRADGIVLWRAHAG
jgi:competence protein ComEC